MEYTKEFIEKQLERIKFISPLPWKACSCGKCGFISNEKDCIATATRGDWGDDYPIIKPVGGSISGKYEIVMEQITYGNIPPETGNINAQYIAHACNNYPKSLDEIEKLQARVAELEAERRWISISERLPSKNDDYLVIPFSEDADEYYIIAQFIDGVFLDDYDEKIDDILYWMPLPELPKEEKRGEIKDYKEHLNELTETEYKKLHLNDWSLDEQPKEHE